MRGWGRARACSLWLLGSLAEQGPCHLRRILPEVAEGCRRSRAEKREAGRVGEQVLRTNTCPKCGGSLFVREEVHRFLTYGLGHDGVIEGTPGSVKRVDDDGTLTLWCVDCRAVLGYGSRNREGRFEGVLLEEPGAGSAEGQRS